MTLGNNTLNGEFLSLESARKLKAINELSKDLGVTYDKIEKQIRTILKEYKKVKLENATLKKENKEYYLLIREGIENKKRVFRAEKEIRRRSSKELADLYIGILEGENVDN